MQTPTKAPLGLALAGVVFTFETPKSAHVPHREAESIALLILCVED